MQNVTSPQQDTVPNKFPRRKVKKQLARMIRTPRVQNGDLGTIQLEAMGTLND